VERTEQPVRKASRLFEIIQILRLADRPITAAQIAERLEVTPRSIYRDIVALQAMRVPIEGGRGIGYILRPGFDLPPLMFSIEETEAIVLALALLQRTGDLALRKAAKSVNDKIAGAMPPPLRQSLTSEAIHAWGTVMPEPDGIDLALVRSAIRDERKLHIAYQDEQGRTTERTVRPIALIYYSAHSVMVAWCELRNGLRNFRADRITEGAALPDRFTGEGDRLRKLWIDGWETNSTKP
jgi:predicted DNA-binding transcriptional regulator YafY